MISKRLRIFRIISLFFVLSLFLLISIAYIQFRDLKKAVTAQIASRATSFIGQKVSVGDLSFGPAGEINLHAIAVHNPEGFAEGKLLTIKKLSMKPRYRELFRQHFYFDRIVVKEPELAVMRDSHGRFNISDNIRKFFGRESALHYRINKLAVQSGAIGFNNRKEFISDDVHMIIEGLSSEPDAKALIRGHARYAGGRTDIEGWIFPKANPKRLNLKISSQDLPLSLLQDLLNRHGMEMAKTKAAFFLNVEGDTAKGINFSSEIGVRDAGFSFLKKDAKEIHLSGQAFLNIPGKALIIDRVSLKAGGVAAATGRGEMKMAEDGILYSATVKISALDLSAVNVLKDVKMSGIVNSDNLSIRGNLKRRIPEISGDIQLSHAKVEARDVYIGRLDADMTLRSADEGALDLQMKDMKYGGYSFPWLRAKSGVAYRGNVIALKSVVIKSQEFEASSNRAVIMVTRNGKDHSIKAEIKGAGASCPARGAGIKNAVLSMTIKKAGDVFTGAADFSAAAVMFKDATAGFTKGTVRVDNMNYSADILQADIAGGTLTVKAAGRISPEMFPITVKSSANSVNLEFLSENIAKISGESYPLSGTLANAFFEGTIESAESIRGKAGIQAEKLAIFGKNKRSFLREAALKADIEFKGMDFDVRADADAGRISAKFIGTVKSFGKRHRSAEVKIIIPEARANEVREAFWDIFPDRLLYAGLEGSLASDLTMRYDGSAIGVNGTLLLKGITVEGENGEFTVGPVDGAVPVEYSRAGEFSGYPGKKGGEVSGNVKDTIALPPFERGEFQKLRDYYAQETVHKDFSLITIGAVSYGFEMLNNVRIWVRPDGKFLHIGHFSGNIFGGTLNGSAVIDLADGLQYKGGFFIEGLSLKNLCDRIEPVRGYLTGRVNGVATLKGEGAGLSRIIGKADFWTYSTSKEKTGISREFLQKVGGVSLKRYLGDRTFDKGVMNLYLQGGYVIFRELEISNRNFFGMKDLDIKVAPFNNRISLDRLMWSITEAAYRARKN